MKHKITMEAVAAYRPFPVALGQEIAKTKLGAYDRMALLTRVYTGLKPADRLRCITELELCKAAKRGELEARVG